MPGNRPPDACQISAPSLCATPVVYPEGQAVRSRPAQESQIAFSGSSRLCVVLAHTTGARLDRRIYLPELVSPQIRRNAHPGISFAFDSHRIPLRDTPPLAIWASDPASTPPSSPIRVHPVHRRPIPRVPHPKFLDRNSENPHIHPRGHKNFRPIFPALSITYRNYKNRSVIPSATLYLETRLSAAFP